MPDTLKREDDIDSAYDYNPKPTAEKLHNLEGYDRKNDGLDDHPISGGAADGVEPDAANSVRQAEEAPAADWATNFKDNKGFGKSKINVVKKGGPMGLIVGLLLGGGGLIGFFGGPGLLIVNMAETLTNKFNYQLTSMDIRTNKVLNAKISNTTKGICTPIKISCRYSTFSNKEIANFEKAGIVVSVDNTSKTIVGRNKVTNFQFEGKPIAPADFAKTVRNNPSFNAAVKQGYNPKFAGFADKIFAKIEAKLKISKADPFSESNTTDDQRLKKLELDTANGQGDTLTQHKVGEQIDPNCPPANKCATYTQEQIDAEVKARSLADAAAKVDSTDTKATSTAMDELAKGGSDFLGKSASVVKVTGIVDNACTVYGMIKAVSIGAKVIRSAQLARFAMTILTTASMIKSGDAKPGDVAFIGTMLTKTVSSKLSNGNTFTTKSATDSSGYQYAEGYRSGIDAAATPYMAGGGLGGELSGVTAAVLSLLGGNRNSADTTCKLNNNYFVQGGSFLVGIALMIIPGGQAFEIGKLAAQAAFGATVFAAQLLLPSMIADMIAGKLVDQNTFGEAAGNALTSGTGKIMADTSLGGGNAPLKVAQAQKLTALNNQVQAEYAVLDRQTHSPLDASNPNTLLGSIYSQFIPVLYGGDGSVTSKIGGIASIVGGTLSNLFPQAKAATTESFSECQDLEYRAIGLATDPFCNPVSGIPATYLTSDPVAVNNRLEAAGLIDPTTGDPIGAYATFVSDCIDRTEPFGSTGSDSSVPDGSGCFLADGSGALSAEDQTKADEYVHYVDQRILDGMENGYDSQTVIPQGNVAIGSGQDLAKQILANSNITIVAKYNPQITAYANGDFSCNLDPALLQMIATLGQTYKLDISSFNRFCTGALTASGTGSLHYANGGGRAVDFDIINGTAATGARPIDIKFINQALSLLPASRRVEVGQVQCRQAIGKSITIPSGMTVSQVNDDCTHVHIGVYP